ncbi:MAG: methylamine utilization protein [Bythopirellula sp.]
MRTCITTMLIALAMTQAAHAADWGNLKGRLVFAGDAGTPAKINVNKDAEFCSQFKLVDEVLSVGEKGGLQNAFVYLYVKRGKSVDVHPDMEAPSDKAAVLDNKGCRFEPHAMIIRTGQTLEVRNSDEGVGHNTNASFIKNPAFNQLIAAGSPITKVFEKNESIPAGVACNVHPWMKAYILIRDNPYMAVTRKDGSFEIKNIPAGKHEFIFWHELKGNLAGIDAGGEKTSRKGRAKLTIPAGETLDLGDIKVSAKALGK